jgi:hypothetical protein
LALFGDKTGCSGKRFIEIQTAVSKYLYNLCHYDTNCKKFNLKLGQKFKFSSNRQKYKNEVKYKRYVEIKC